MFQSRRFTKKQKKKRRGGLFWVLASILPIVILLLFVTLYIRRPTYVSPVPFSKISIPFISKLDPLAPVIEKLKEKHVDYTAITLVSNGFSVQLPTGEDIIFSNAKNLDSQISSLQLILPRLTIEGKRIARLDFRFDNPVIVFK